MGSMLTSHLRATYDAAVQKWIWDGRGRFAQVQAGERDCRSKLTAVYAESQDESVSVTTLLNAECPMASRT